MGPIKVGDRMVGPGHPVLIVAEIGLNHNGDMTLALDSIDAAAEAGADAVKFQNYRTEDFLRDRSLTYTYVSGGREVIESQFDMFKRCELNAEALAALKGRCDQRGILFCSTPTGRQGIDDLVAVGAPMLKNGSDFLNNTAVVRAMGETGLPTVLSTGMATLAEIDQSVTAFRRTGNENLILLVCTSLYPTPPEEAHVARVATLGRAFGCLAGFSDHTEGHAAAVSATCFGSCFLEKHFTLDRNLPGPDHRFSLDPRGLAELVAAVREGERAIGVATIGATASEKAAREGHRLSCIAARDLAAGATVRPEDVSFSRPATGLPPSMVELFAGRILSRGVKAGELFQFGDFR